LIHCIKLFFITTYIYIYIGEKVLKSKNAFKSTTLSQGTIETGNKRRPVLIKKGSQRFEPLPPSPPDPNSGSTCKL